ncbi:Glycogen debranching enzyme (alpha-1,6-glucosidase) [Candidatus Nanohalovita haloferacivicina]|nr:Glycogen debranching enzyme (alpha-1,6-glucosidase) [Candidatus Nanohalobia archaeon BNXNv]
MKVLYSAEFRIFSMYSLNQDLSKKYGVISNLHGFLNRHFDTGFKSKWSGYWVPPYKFLDYYAIKINGVWINESTVRNVEYGEKMIFHHKAGSLDVKEIVETPDQLPGFRISLEIQNNNSSKKAAHIVVEPAVDIRSKSEDIAEGEYSVETGKGKLSVSRNDKKLMISGKDFKVEKDSQYKTHYPGGVEQECFIPGRVIFREEVEAESSSTAEVEFSTSSGSFGTLESSDSGFENIKLGQGFSAAVRSMENLVYDRKGKGIIAGHPWFQNYWSRDTYWTLLGLIDAGHFELSHEILENFAEEEGFPNQISLEGGQQFPNSDAAPLFVIAADKLRRHWKISEKIEDKMEEAFHELELDENGVVEHDPEGTWMDTLERPSAVDIQALWLKAAEIQGLSLQSNLEEGLEEFIENDRILDSLGDNPSLTINPAIALMFDQASEKYMEDINAEFSSRHGARTRSVVDPGYDASGYHTGSVWGLTTGWASAANFQQGKDVQGMNFLEKMKKYIMREQVGGFHEVVDAEEGHLMGCGEQAWSAGMYVHVIDSYLLGIEAIDSETVRINPSDLAEGRRVQKRIGDEYLDIEFGEDGFEVLNSPDLEILRGEEQ